jgi:octaprenyl-diphosphate synthase
VRRAIVGGGREDFAQVLGAIQVTRALDYARAVAQREVGLAAHAIEALPPSEHRESLLELAAFAVSRRG